MCLRRDEYGHVRLVVVLLVCLLLGFAFGACGITAEPAWCGECRDCERAGLSAGTKAVLQRVAAPVEVRFYSVLDPATTAETLRTFAGRVDQLLSEFEKEAGGKIKVVRHSTPSAVVAAAASSDGIRPFNLDKGEACYLALVVSQKDRKELLPDFSPDWEPALESDLSRAMPVFSTFHRRVYPLFPARFRRR